ncbi:unnamed protein product [Sympodiomycopsis kandeliae]
MSIRFHRTAPLLTFYHNPKSPQSLAALAVLRKAQRGLESSTEGNNRPSSPNHSSTEKATDAIRGEDVEPVEIRGDEVGRGEQFLQEAASDTSQSLEIDLEIKERSKEPPTQAQIQTILDYLKGNASLTLNSSSDASTAGSPASAGPQQNHPGATGLPGNPMSSSGKTMTRVKQSQTQSPASSAPWSELDSASVVERLKNSDLLLVDWENGRAVTNLQGVRMLLALLHSEQKDPTARNAGANSSTGCQVM